VIRGWPEIARTPLRDLGSRRHLNKKLEFVVCNVISNAAFANRCYELTIAICETAWKDLQLRYVMFTTNQVSMQVFYGCVLSFVDVGYCIILYIVRCLHVIAHKNCISEFQQRQWRIQEFGKGGTRGGLGACPQRGPGAAPRWGVRGAKPPWTGRSPPEPLSASGGRSPPEAERFPLKLLVKLCNIW